MSYVHELDGLNLSNLSMDLILLLHIKEHIGAVQGRITFDFS